MLSTEIAPSLKVLVEAGCDVNKAMNDGRTPLIQAALKGHELVVAALIEGGAQVDKENSVSGFTPLMNAAFFGRAVVLRWLLAAGANSGRANKGGRTEEHGSKRCWQHRSKCAQH